MGNWVQLPLKRNEEKEEKSLDVENDFDLTPEQVEELIMVSCFSVRQLKVLRARFKEVDVDGDNFISKEEFAQIKELKHNPLSDRIFAFESSYRKY